MHYKHYVIVLPTEDKTSPLGKYKDTGSFVYNDVAKDIPRGEMHHMYITSDDTIRKGDWILSKNNVILKAQGSEARTDVKIIATTNTKLTVPSERSGDNVWHNSLPSIPQSFIESYVSNPMNEVGIEIEHNDETKLEVIRPWSSVYRYKLVNNEVVVVEHYIKTKALNPITKEAIIHDEYTNNTRQATTQEIYDEFDVKLYTIEDVEKLCLQAYVRGGLDEHSNGTFDQWIKENLL